MQLGRPLSVVLSSWTRLLVGLSGWEGPPGVPHRWVELDILLCIWAVLQATFPVGQDLWLSSLPRGSQGLCSAMGQGFIPGSAAGKGTSLSSMAGWYHRLLQGYQVPEATFPGGLYWRLFSTGGWECEPAPLLGRTLGHGPLL